MGTSITLHYQRGPRDDMFAPTALESLETADWLVANRPEPGGLLEQAIADRFDYDGEDRLVEAYRAAVGPLQALAPQRPEGGYAPHAYAHPKQADQTRDHRQR